MRSLIPAVACLLFAMIVTACQEDKKESLSGVIDPEIFPTMMTRNVETLISDSGITRYRITSPLWLVFDEAKEPYWNFPNKLKLEKYDSLLRVEATVTCDSARYFKNPELWRLDGNVNISNILKEKFLTEQLFWDQRNHKIYSDSFIHIEKSDRIIEGYGFVSDEQMTNYTVKNVAGIFPVEENSPTGQANSSSPLPAPPGTPVQPMAVDTADAELPVSRKPAQRNSAVQNSSGSSATLTPQPAPTDQPTLRKLPSRTH